MSFREKESSEEHSPKGFRTTRSFHPKRVSELPPLESDSESDGDGNLNCAILNDSFLLTPSKCAEDVENGQKQSGEKSTIPRRDSSTNPKSRLNLVDKISSVSDIHPAEKKTKRPPLVERSQQETNTSIIGSSVTAPSSYINAVDPGGIEDKQSNAAGNASNNPSWPVSIAEKNDVDKSRHEFYTPREKLPMGQVRGTGARMLTSTALRGSRNTLENEFKSQKILFATPLAIARTPGMSMVNESLTLSDTPIKIRETKYLSPIDEQPQQLSSKRSTNQLFGHMEKPDAASSKPEGQAKAAINTEENRCKSSTDSTQPLKERPITINGKQYSVISKLGSGGSSSVFLAKQVASGLECAVKLVNLNGDANLVEGYLNETKLLAKLQTNENVIALYDYAHIPEAGQLFLVMEKGECDLHRILQGYSKDIPLYSLMSIWYQMVQCVHYIHDHGVIHLDLKPANFLMIRGRLKLIDFGIASNIAFDSTSIMKFSQAGTFNYISPEALIDTSGEMSPNGSQPRIKMSKKSDIWSLGCILYLLLYKRTPFAHIKNIYTKVNVITNPNTVIEYPPLASYYPPMLLDILKRCLRYDAKSRASTAELLDYPYDMVIPIKNMKIKSFTAH
ncbi:dual specificity protein kinase TTK [Anopheles cruzii]|uniref:dual specificity protein kinase TTK n=1 Tax=Anopheles cruzii TaxID=68878 RepID=UPI0022EC5CB7|nr:dual specificity protein kinase TTK [Anopheles cruzii]